MIQEKSGYGRGIGPSPDLGQLELLRKERGGQHNQESPEKMLS